MKLAIVILAAFLVSVCSGRTVRGVPATDPVVATTTQGATSPEATVPENTVDQVATAGESEPAGASQGPVPNLDEELGYLDQILTDLDRAMVEMSEELNNTEGETTP